MVVVTEGHECTMMKGAGGHACGCKAHYLGGVAMAILVAFLAGQDGSSRPRARRFEEGTRSNTICYNASKLVVALHIDWIIDFY
jgi:hypothetical protein